MLAGKRNQGTAWFVFYRSLYNGNKSTKYHSYIKPNNHYWRKVNVTKNTPFSLLREILWETSFPFLLIYFCLATTTVPSITEERKEKSKAKKPKKINMSIDVLKNLQIKANVQLVRTCVLVKYLEHHRRKRRLPDRPATYLNDLGKRIEKEVWSNQGIRLRRKPPNGSFIEWGCALGTIESQLFLFKWWSW